MKTYISFFLPPWQKVIINFFVWLSRVGGFSSLYILNSTYVEFLNAVEVKIENVSLFCVYKFFILLKCEICRVKAEQTEKRKTIDLKENVWQSVSSELNSCRYSSNCGVVKEMKTWEPTNCLSKLNVRSKKQSATFLASRRKVLNILWKVFFAFHHNSQ